MVKIGRNDPCPCGSSKKFKKCCLDKKPRERIVMVGSPEPLRGIQYDKDKMEFMGLTDEGRLIEPEVTFTQTQYIGHSGKEKIISRVQDKVIADEADLMRYLSSSFDQIIGIDTNTKIIRNDTVSVATVVQCVVHGKRDHNGYRVDFSWKGAIPFRNCPSELPSEKYGWMAVIQEINQKPQNKAKRIAIVTDHDLGNHTSYNSKQIPIFREFYLPDNFKLIYGRGDGPDQNLLNSLVKKCDKESTELLKEIEKNGYYQRGGKKITINHIPVPGL
jgi:SEC-C motif